MTTKACCDAGLPAKAVGEPVGKVIDLANPGGKDLPCYVVGEGEKAIIAVYDIFGFTENKRTRLVCDEMAEAGYSVILPDFYRGEDVLTGCGSFPPEGGIPAVVDWLNRVAPFEQVLGEIFDVVVKHLESNGAKSIGMVGFCWGGKVVMLSSTRGKVKAGVGLHPSFLTPEDAANVDCPQFFMPAGDDPPIEPVFDALSSKPFFDKCKKKLFGEMSHGFTLRADMSDPSAAGAKQANEAIGLAIDFFGQHL